MTVNTYSLSFLLIFLNMNTSTSDSQSSQSNQSNDATTLPKPKHVAYVEGTDFNSYMKQLKEANIDIFNIYKTYKMYAFTRMTSGLVLDFIPPGVDVYHALSVSRKRGYSLAGLSERMAKYVYKEALTYLSPLFFDMDLETNQVVTFDMIQDLINQVVFPCANTFFDLQNASSALHVAVYSPLDDNGALQPSIKKHMVCGWCRDTKLKMTMNGSIPVAECSTCALQFQRSIETNDVARLPIMVSKSKLLMKHNSTRAFKIKFLRQPEPWTPISDESIDFELPDSVIKFKVNTQEIDVQLPTPRNHIVKVKRKYSIHIKALQNTHADPKQQFFKNELANRRFSAYKQKFREHPSKLTMQEFVEWQYRKRRYQNKQKKYFESNAVTRSFANKQVPQYFGFPIYTMRDDDKQMCEHLLSNETIANVVVTQEIFLFFIAYVMTTATHYQSKLSDEHPLKHVDILEMFDAAPVINGAALRVCFDTMNEHKPIKCKCPNVDKGKRKRGVRGQLLSSIECEDCHGKGYYMDRSRNPTRLVKILVDPEHSKYLELQNAMDTYLPRLHEPSNLPILLTMTSTRINLKCFDEPLPNYKLCGDITTSIEACMRGVPKNIIYKKKNLLPSGPHVVDGHILDTVRNYIQDLDDNCFMWKSLTVQALVPWNNDKFPRYSVKIHATCGGCQWCIYKNDEHSSNSVYFVLVPPKKQGNVGYIYAACWSKKCSGFWKNSCLRDKTKWPITPQDVNIIWPGIHQKRMNYSPNFSDATFAAQSMLGHSSHSTEEMETSSSSSSNRNVASSATSSNVKLSFREILQSNVSHKRLLMSYEYFRIPDDKSDMESIILEAHRALNLVGT